MRPMSERTTMGKATRATQKNNLMIYFGHHKCASQYIGSIVGQLCSIYSLSMEVKGLSDKLPFEYHLKDFWKKKISEIFAPDLCCDADFRCYDNASQVLVGRLGKINYKGFHVIRDPRDIIIAAYFSHKYSHPVTNPWLFENRERLLKVNREEGLLCVLDYCSVFFEGLATWDYSNPRIYETCFETLIWDPYNEFYRIFNFIGFKFGSEGEAFINIAMRKISRRFGFAADRLICSPDILKRLLKKYAFERLSGGRGIGVEDQKSHYRKGIVGDWRNYFTPRVKSEFKKKYAQLLIDLGYEIDARW